MPMIQSSFSDPDMIVKTLARLLLFVHQSCLTSAQKVIENGHGFAVLGAEDKIVDYAELVVDEQANLPSQVFQNLGLPALISIFSVHHMLFYCDERSHKYNLFLPTSPQVWDSMDQPMSGSKQQSPDI